MHKIIGLCAIVGAILLFVGTLLHPMQADPNDAMAAFTEYAADHIWVASHLTQLVGVTLMVIALLFLAEQLKSSKGATIARIGAAFAISSLAIAAALQAVDGIALKNMINAWSAATASQKDGLLQATFAVRQIEIGLASMFSLFMGLTAALFGMALFKDSTYSRWFSSIAIAGGISTAMAGIVMAYTGFSSMMMMINMPANFILLLWMMTLGVLMWRQQWRQADITNGLSVR
jgi:hypothetical protein